MFAFLADPATHGGQPVTRIDTHGAAVFLAGDRVLKVKRAVKFPFLDYSTLEKRKAACEAEIAVNGRSRRRSIAACLAITRDSDGRLAHRRRRRGRRMGARDAALRRERDARPSGGRGRIDDALADALARAVAAAHARRRRSKPTPWIDALADYIGQNDEAFREFPDLFPPDDAAQLTAASRAAFAALRPLLRERGEQGLVRRGHGDLHLGNIALIDGKPVLFDAIEFDPLVASGDVLYDLAFLLMDLVERGLRHAANIVLNRYLAETARDEDFDALAALPLFLSMRAAIRAKVTAAKLENAKADEKPAIEKSAQRLFRARRRG